METSIPVQWFVCVTDEFVGNFNIGMKISVQGVLCKFADHFIFPELDINMKTGIS